MLKRGLDERLQGLAAGGLGLSVPGAPGWKARS
jgi:hypothetical protein